MRILGLLIGLVAAAVLLSAGPALAAGKKTAGKGPADYFLEIQRTGYDVRVLVNKVLVVKEADALSALFLKLTPFLKNGRNNISVIWAKVSAHETSFKIEVLEWPKGASREQAKSLVAYKPIEDIYKGETEQRTFGFIAKIPVEWSWENGRRVGRLSERDREVLTGTLGRLHESFAGRDLDGVMRALDTSFRDLDFRKGKVIRRVRKHYAKCMESAGWGMEPFSSSALEFKSYGRMVRVSGQGPVIAAVEVEGCGKISFTAFYFTRLKKGWTLVRAN